jgi:hypothetical protein
MFRNRDVSQKIPMIPCFSFYLALFDQPTVSSKKQLERLKTVRDRARSPQLPYFLVNR